MRNIKSVIEEHIINNAKIYLILIIIFLIGLIIGIIIANNSSQEQITSINNYINSFINGLKNGEKIDYIKLLKNVLENNFLIVLLLWFMGSTIIGIPIVYGIIGYKGFCMGYTISSIVLTLGTGKGIAFVLSALFLHNILIIPCLIAIAVSGVNLYKSIIKDRRRENIRIEIIRHTILCLIILVIIGFSALIETYLSSNLLISIVNYL